MERTISWYVANSDWWNRALNADFSEWMKQQYAERSAAESAA